MIVCPSVILCCISLITLISPMFCRNMARGGRVSSRARGGRAGGRVTTIRLGVRRGYGEHHHSGPGRSGPGRSGPSRSSPSRSGPSRSPRDVSRESSPSIRAIQMVDEHREER